MKLRSPVLESAHITILSSILLENSNQRLDTLLSLLGLDSFAMSQRRRRGGSDWEAVPRVPDLKFYLKHLIDDEGGTKVLKVFSEKSSKEEPPFSPLSMIPNLLVVFILLLATEFVKFT